MKFAKKTDRGFESKVQDVFAYLASKNPGFVCGVFISFSKPNEIGFHSVARTRVALELAQKIATDVRLHLAQRIEGELAGEPILDLKRCDSCQFWSIDDKKELFGYCALNRIKVTSYSLCDDWEASTEIAPKKEVQH